MATQNNTNDFEKSRWIQRMTEIKNDPQALAKLETTINDWLNNASKKSPIIRRVHQAYQMFQAWRNNEAVLSPRNAIMLGAALLYAVSPLDAVPDIMPIIGLLDDLGVITLILSIIIPEYLKYETSDDQRKQLIHEAEIIKQELKEADKADDTVEGVSNEDSSSFAKMARRFANYFKSKR